MFFGLIRSYIDKKYYQVYQNMFQLVDDICKDDNLEELAKQVDVIFFIGSYILDTVISGQIHNFHLGKDFLG